MTDRFATISPSAKSLLLVKAQTTLPYANAAARLLWGDDVVEDAARKEIGNAAAEGRRLHFELRARSLDEALRGVGATRVLELAAGLSFRGLEMASRKGVTYVDSDLSEVAEIKTSLVARLHPAPLAGQLIVRALNALDAADFQTTVNEIPPGPLAVVHEGLLMYLDDLEKAKLAANIRGALLERSGWWMTADVYVRSETHLLREERTAAFLEKHRVEEKKFADLQAADTFFVSNGFSVEKKMTPVADPWRMRETWVMTPHR
jgi:O-methyltransferase involved in polyketide biosynthesis